MSFHLILLSFLNSTILENFAMSTLEKSGKRIVFTGGSGMAGRHAIAKLLEYGHKILNVDIVPLDNPDVYTLKADLTDGAQAFNSLSCHFNVSEPFQEPLQTPDAVIHFAGIYSSIHNYNPAQSHISY
jgi:nucleoside-diphosphate-sugar epimerase